MLLLLAGCLLLTACGGGGGAAPAALASQQPAAVNPDPTPPADPVYVTGIFETSTEFESYCENPRPGTADMLGSELFEKHWMRSWTHDFYLWYDEVSDQDPADFDDKLVYFDELKTAAVTPSGAPRDQFHFTLNTEEWQQLSQSGVSTGYGMSLIAINPSPPRELYVRFVEPGSPAFIAGVRRGSRIIELDGADFINGNTQSDFDAFDAALSPASSGESHDFVMLHPGDAGNSSFSMTSDNIISSPVLISDVKTTASGKVGYLVFNDHIATAEQQLRDVFTDFEAEGLSDLVLDIRYNGGGFLAIASQLAYMITGDADTDGKIFELQTFNDQHTVVNPFNGQPIIPMPFFDATLGFSVSPGQSLPSLGLRRVYVITTGATCSASESIINSLRGINIEIIQIGSTTCGKPYGFFPTDNCGTTYFSIHFKGENDIGFGDYSDGFSPANTTGFAGVLVAGCAALDDLGHDLGDINEGLLATALQYRDSMTCPVAPVSTIFATQSLPDDQRVFNLSGQDSLAYKILGIP